MFKKLDTGSIAAGILLSVGPPPEKPEGPTHADLNDERDDVRKQIAKLEEKHAALDERMDDTRNVWNQYTNALQEWETKVGKFATKCVEGERS